MQEYVVRSLTLSVPLSFREIILASQGPFEPVSLVKGSSRGTKTLLKFRMMEASGYPGFDHGMDQQGQVTL